MTIQVEINNIQVPWWLFLLAFLFLLFIVGSVYSLISLISNALSG